MPAPPPESDPATVSAIFTMIRSLHERRGREWRGLTLAEGIRLVEEASAANLPVRAALHP
jgi:hypothetical protein